MTKKQVKNEFKYFIQESNTHIQGQQTNRDNRSKIHS